MRMTEVPFWLRSTISQLNWDTTLALILVFAVFVLPSIGSSFQLYDFMSNQRLRANRVWFPLWGKESALKLFYMYLMCRSLAWVVGCKLSVRKFIVPGCLHWRSVDPHELQRCDTKSCDYVSPVFESNIWYIFQFVSFTKSHNFFTHLGFLWPGVFRLW